MIKLSHREADIVVSIERPTSGPYIITRLSDYCLKIYGSKNYLANTPHSSSRRFNPTSFCQLY